MSDDTEDVLEPDETVLEGLLPETQQLLRDAADDSRTIRAAKAVIAEAVPRRRERMLAANRSDRRATQDLIAAAVGHRLPYIAKEIGRAKREQEAAAVLQG